MRIGVAVCLGLVLLAATARAGAGQSFQGGLRGSVRDPGGVVPGVELTLTNESTNVKRVSVSNERGEYNFAALDPGNYTLKAALQGFKTIERSGLRVGTQQFLVIDLTLDVGVITENVTVTGQTPLIETANASQGGVLDSKMLETLPAPGRNAYLIGATMPTVIPSGDAQFNRQQDQSNASLLSLGGGARRANNYLLDGVTITDLRNRASANATIEAIEDVKIQVHTYDAEMGRTGGGVFNVTAKSGSNDPHGSGFFQTRPRWGQANNYFNALRGQPLPKGYYYLGGGGVGGAIAKNRTFFWFATENYGSNTTRNVAVRVPTDLERAGDFSQTFDSHGNLVVIYDPLTTRTDPATGRLIRDPFANNRIPSGRFNGVAVNMLKYLPHVTNTVDTGATNYNVTGQILDRAQMYTGKIEHKFNDRVSLSGFYVYNRTNEPCADYFDIGLKGPNRFADPADYILKRRPKILAINNTWIPSSHSVLTLRFGLTRFPDNNTLSIDFDPATLGFNPSFANALPIKKFPMVSVTDHNYNNIPAGGGGNRMMGAVNPTEINWYSHAFNGSYSRFIGTHTARFGADYRKVGVDFLIPGQGAGTFNFDREFTSCDPTVNGVDAATATCPVSGNAIATMLLGYPSGNPGNLSNVPISTPFNGYTRYYAGYAQDDWRVSSRFTLNYGLRVEHEDGLREAQNRFTVGFDPTLSNALTNKVTIPADAVAGTQPRQPLGGFMYAGVNGAPTAQGNQPKVKWSPRAGIVYMLTDKTVLRAGYGVYWAPWNYQAPNTTNYGQIGYTQTTEMTGQNQFTPTITLDNPFPSGLQQPIGNTGGPLTGVGTAVNYIDQHKAAPRVQQYSADLQRELGANVSLTFSYIGARGDHLGLGGSADATVNINAIDPKYLSLGAALLQSVPNPFFGVAEAGPLSTQATVQRRTLLRPFPQFGNISARQMTEGKSRYHAGVIELQKRLTRGWGGRFSYTYSRLEDNQFAESNFFSQNDANTPYPWNFVAGSPYYNPDVEYSYGLLDVPHRVVLSPIVEVPFGEGRRWLNGSGVVNAIFGGWTVSAIVSLESGFPINVSQTDNSNSFSGGQRPNVNAGVNPNTAGDDQSRFAGWISPAGFTAAPSFTIGSAPRTFATLRTPVRNNLDAVFAKEVRLTGGVKAQVRLEMLNLTNTVKVIGPVQSVSASNFGEINTQSGFMRLTQVMFRLSF